jgi:hypothetical protein
MEDRIGLRVTLTIMVCLALGQACTGDASASQTPGIVAGDYCDPDDGARSWTSEEKQRTRDRVWSACKAVEGSDLYCGFFMAAIARESWGGVASAVHTQGEDGDGRKEFGLGALGLSVRWHSGKWPGDDANPAFCSPEASFIVAHTIARRAVLVLGARNAVDVQAVYGGGQGAVQCSEVGAPAWVFDAPLVGWLVRLIGVERQRSECRIYPKLRHSRAVCDRMRHCRRPLTAADVGLGVPLEDRRAWALAQARKR